MDQARPAVPDYELLRIIGHGTFGEVWLARSKATGALRAAKIVWRYRFEDERPFQREFEGVQKFERISREHPGQLALFHVGRNEAEGYFYSVMELADDLNEQSNGALEPRCDVSDAKPRHSPGAPLPDPASYVAHTLRADLKNGRLPAERVLEIGLPLAEALGHLHSHGLVHRDVKPSNIIFVNGRPKLADIGLVTDASDQCSFAGTEGYLLLDALGTPQADIFALGKVLYEAITGMDRRKFPDLPQDLRSWPDAGLATELNEIILRACAVDHRTRYQNADETRQDLLRLKASKSLVRTRRMELRWRNVRRGAAWLAGAGAVFGLFAVANHALHPGTFPYVEKRSANSQANASYDQGKTYFDQFTSNDFAQAVACFQQATQADPNFAAPYGYLATTYSWSSSDGWNVGWREISKAKEFAQRALALDDSLAEPHLALGAYHQVKEWNWSAAEEEFKTAMRLNQSSLCRVTYAEFLRASGRMKEALAQITEARTRDPNSRIINQRLASYLRDAHRFQEALDEIGRIEAMGLGGRMATVKISALCALGRYKEAVDLEQQLLPGSSQSEQRQKFYDQLRSAVEFGNSTNAYWSARLTVTTNPYERACCFAQMQNSKGALNALNEAANQTNAMLTFAVTTDWRLDRIRSEPGFRDVLKKMHLQ
jgi:serine/threonine protein kinase